MCDLPNYLRLQQGRVKEAQLQKIRATFGSLEQAFAQSQADWAQHTSLKPWQLEQLFADDIQARVEAAFAWGQQENQQWLTLDEAAYPHLLREINDAPIILGVRGRIELLNDPQIAVVGSRHATKSAVSIAEDFAHFLSKSGVTITSGLAAGIDAAAHRGALKGNAGTIAVVGTGLDRIYPAANQHLGRDIAEQGAMVSEFPLGTPPLSQNFPQRNRIISGLSLGTLVVEAALKSGSLITARIASEQGREVFAIPGSIHNPQAKGCHFLIKNGAKLVESGQDVFEELLPQLQGVLNFASENEEILPPASNQAQKSDSKLLQWIEYEPISLDELAVLSKMPVSALQAELVLLELSGQIEALSAGRWQRIS